MSKIYTTLITLRAILTLTFLILVSWSAKAQFYEGMWKGEFRGAAGLSPNQYAIVPVTHISFLFEVVDSSYKVYSHTWGKTMIFKDTLIITKMYYRKISESEIYLEELDDSDSTKFRRDCGFQKFNLRVVVKKKHTYLKGTWSSLYEGCERSGTVWVRRKNK